MSNGFTFNGTHSKTKNIKAIKAPRNLLPQRKTKFVEIPFRSEPYIILDNSVTSEVISIECWLSLEGKTIFETVREWGSWLHTDIWAELVFDDDPSFSYKAMCVTSITTDDLRSPIVTIEFRCAYEEKEVESV